MGMDLAEEPLRLMGSLILYVVLVLTMSVLYPVFTDGATTVDGLYWTIITFTTIGLGDKTLDYTSDISLHGNFHVFQILLMSSGLAVMAAVIGNICAISKNLWSVTLTAKNNMLSSKIVETFSLGGTPPSPVSPDRKV